MREQGRYVKYVFPFVDCAIKYYVRMRRPVRMSDIIRCMREGYKDKFSIKSVGKVYRIKDSAKEYGYIREVEVGRRRGRPISRYVPTISGLVDLAIYRDLKRVFRDAVDELSPHSLLCLLRVTRITMLMNMLYAMLEAILFSRAMGKGAIDQYPRLTMKCRESTIMCAASLSSRSLNIVDLISYSLTPCLLKCLSYIDAVVEESLRGSEDFRKAYVEYMRKKIFIELITLKALAGIEVRDLSPEYYVDIETLIQNFSPWNIWGRYISYGKPTDPLRPVISIIGVACNTMARS
ncbi:MAG: hypothetical protein L7H08_06525 [Vulcanisaeta sp.]|nr:hypothetical protein [Vulcanisaeta sp.]